MRRSSRSPEAGSNIATPGPISCIRSLSDETMDVVKRAVDAVAAKAPRVSLVLKADVRPGVTGALTAKVETVERYLRG